MGIPSTAQELLLDGVPSEPYLVTLNVKVRPASASVQIYLSEADHHPITCNGPLKQITVECRSGRIFVEKMGGAQHFEVSIVSRG